MNTKCKLRNQSGFSLAETLLAVLILLLVSVLLANGIPTAKSIYERVTIGANAKVMLTTAVSSLRNELGTAKNIRIQKDDSEKYTVIKYYSTDTHATSKIYLNDGLPPVIMLREYDHLVNAEGVGVEIKKEGVSDYVRRLLTSDSQTEKLYVTYDGVSAMVDVTDPAKPQNRQIVKIEGLKVKRDDGDGKSGNDTVFAELPELYIKTIMDGAVNE